MQFRAAIFGKEGTVEIAWRDMCGAERLNELWTWQLAVTSNSYTYQTCREWLKSHFAWPTLSSPSSSATPHVNRTRILGTKLKDALVTSPVRYSVYLSARLAEHLQSLTCGVTATGNKATDNVELPSSPARAFAVRINLGSADCLEGMITTCSYQVHDFVR